MGEITEGQRFEAYMQQLNEVWLTEWVVPVGLVLQALVDNASAQSDAAAQGLADSLAALAASCPPVAGRGLVQAMAERAAALARCEQPNDFPTASSTDLAKALRNNLTLIKGGKS